MNSSGDIKMIRLEFETQKELDEFLKGRNIKPLENINIKALLGDKERKEIQKSVKETEERVNRLMVDWGIKIVPSKLIEFCYSLLDEELSLTEKRCIEKIIGFVKEMYLK